MLLVAGSANVVRKVVNLVPPEWLCRSKLACGRGWPLLPSDHRCKEVPVAGSKPIACVNLSDFLLTTKLTLLDSFVAVQTHTLVVRDARVLGVVSTAVASTYNQPRFHERARCE